MAKTFAASVIIGAALSKSYSRTLTSAQQQSLRLGQQYQNTNKKLAATGAVIKYKKLLGELRSKQAALGSSSKRLDSGIRDVERRYKDARHAAKGYGVEIGQVVREHGRLNRELKRTERVQKAQARQQAAAGRLGAMRGRMLGLLGSAYGASRLAGSAMAREEQGLYLRTVINAKDGDKDAAVTRARQNAKAFARNSLASEQEVLEIEYALNSAGLEEETARAGTQLVHKLAKVTRGMPEQVGEIFGVTFNNMGESIKGTTDEKMQVIGNVLAKTQFKFQIRDFGQLGESLKYAAASAASARLGLAQTAAVVGQLNSAGLQGSMAGTAFSAVLRNLGKASEELGFEIVRDKQGELDLIATLEQIKEQLDYLDTDERGDLLQELFGDEGKRGVVPLIDQLEQLKAAHVEVANAARSALVDKEYAHFLTSSAGQWQMFRQNIGQVGEVFAGTLLPALNAVLSPIGTLAGWAAASIERFPVIGKAIGAIGATLVGLGSVMTIVTTSAWAWNAAMAYSANQRIAAGIKWLAVKFWGLGKGIFGATLKLRAFNATALITNMRTKALVVGGAIKGFAGSLVGLAGKAIPMVIGGLKALTVALMTNPVGLIIGGIALAAGLIMTFWSPVKGFFTGLWNGVTATFSSAWEWFKGILSFNPLGLIVGNWSGVSDFFTRLWSGIVDQARVALDWLIGKFETVAGFIGNAWNTVTGWFGSGNDDANSKNERNSMSSRLTEAANPVKKAATATVAGAAIALSPVMADQPPAAPSRLDALSQSIHYQADQLPQPAMPEVIGKARYQPALGAIPTLPTLKAEALIVGKAIAPRLDALNQSIHYQADQLPEPSVPEVIGKARYQPALGAIPTLPTLKTEALIVGKTIAPRLDALNQSIHYQADQLPEPTVPEVIGKARYQPALGAIPTLPVPQAPVPQIVDKSTHTYHLSIQQQPGEDAEALATRVMRKIERRNQQRQREVVGDGV